MSVTFMFMNARIRSRVSWSSARCMRSRFPDIDDRGVQVVRPVHGAGIEAVVQP
ncbi:hypothetical protein ABT174_32595 [Streptomyces sparsogenes]|uniref:hypothetical protein n=1 Tax=Streptomyces sparsogenes TaxID=67365 RepID=UPI00332C2181